MTGFRVQSLPLSQDGIAARSSPVGPGWTNGAVKIAITRRAFAQRPTALARHLLHPETTCTVIQHFPIVQIERLEKPTFSTTMIIYEIHLFISITL